MAAAVICFLLLCELPAVMLVCGVWFLKSPPEVNGFIGYKSAMSQKNADTWFTAHRICGRLWTRSGLAAFGVCVLFTVLCAVSELYMTEAMYFWLLAAEGIQLVLLLSVLPLTERRLKKIFFPDGRRR